MERETLIVVECADVAVHYGPTVALQGLSLQVEAGQSVAVMGPSGSGKSTLLRVLCGLQQPDRGVVRMMGEQVTPRTAGSLRANHVGFVYQDYRLVPFLTGLDNVLLAAEFSRQPARGDATSHATAAADLLAELGVGDCSGRLPATMSGGEQQRVAIARALIVRPDVVIADEPTGALDAENSAAVGALLAEIASSRGVAVVVATHDPEVAKAAGLRMQLRDGRLRDTA